MEKTETTADCYWECRGLCVKNEYLCEFFHKGDCPDFQSWAYIKKVSRLERRKMATDIYCPHSDCKNIRKSGFCDLSVIVLEATEDGALTCTAYEAGQPEEED